MKNVTATVKDNILTIKVDLSKSYGLSGSGKSEIVATTSGNQDVPGLADGTKVGVNVFRKAAKPAPSK